MAYNNNTKRDNQGNHRNNGQHSRNKTSVKCSQKNGQKNTPVPATHSNNRSLQVCGKGNRHVNSSGYNPKIFPPTPSFGQISYDGRFIFTSRRGWVVYNPNYKKFHHHNISFQQHNSSNDNRKVEYQANNHYHNCGNSYHVTKNVTNISNSYNTVEKKKKKKKKKKHNETTTPVIYHPEPVHESSGIGKYVAAAAVGVLAALIV